MAHPELGIERALIVKAEWLELILKGIKPWEMRSSATKVRGHIGLIESGSGLIVGTAVLTDSLAPLAEKEYGRYFNKHRIPDSLGTLRAKYKYPWVLENAQRLKESVKYDHPQGAVIWIRF